MMTLLLAIPVVAFVAYELVARFILHNKGMQTLSHLILVAERKWGWPVRVLVAACCIALLVHLEGGF